METAQWVQSGAAMLQFVAAAVIAYLTFRLNQVTKRYAKAADDQAKSAQSQAESAADALKHLREAREVEWRPHLVIHGPPEATVQNVGRGPAIRCCARYLHPEGGNVWVRSQRFDLVSGGTSPMLTWNLNEDTIHNQELHAPIGTIRLYCEDQFGNRYQFTPVMARTDKWELGIDTWPEWGDMNWREERLQM